MLRIDFINVGYGDAIFIYETEQRFSMLVDCGDIQVFDENKEHAGRASSRISAAEFLKEEGIQKIDILVLTHLHLDHCGGITDVLKQVCVKEFWSNFLPDSGSYDKEITANKDFSNGANNLARSLQIYMKALKMMQCKGTRLKEIRRTEVIRIFPGMNVRCAVQQSILSEQRNILGQMMEGTADAECVEKLDRLVNAGSLRLRLLYRDEIIDLPGDFYAACWEKEQDTPCTILKLPHHGHLDSMTQKLLEQLQPREIVISVSNSRKDKCPNPSIIEMLQEYGCKIRFTDAVSIGSLKEHEHRAVRIFI